MQTSHDAGVAQGMITMGETALVGLDDELGRRYPGDIS
jgi:hypothetical protein